MASISNYMSSPVITVDILDSVEQAVSLMEENCIGGLPVLEDGKLCGMITSRDARRSHMNRIIADAMSKNPVFVYTNTSLWDAINLMEEKQVERLPVFESGKLVGIVTKKSLLAEAGKHEDTLTGLKKAPYLRYMAENILSQGKELTVIFFDINGFGKINKKYGHVRGDICLKIIGRLLLERTENGVYFPGRYAGDEFMVITAEDTERSKEWAIKIVNEVAVLTKEFGVPINIVAGVARGGSDGTCIGSYFAIAVDNLINKASLASTISKEEGIQVTCIKGELK
ncbi:Hypoxic response protein 1 [Pelotomaculum schinkii]|uniref:Hypoxic response protein 1 n=1 Tax=Pelotomaculum schinkii TaxID=78350 RepID=A0A4Y7R9R0_9FIRM|nr:GGDEF domain-containing protein [Pelotomaculum schinkii]TEB05449.1 Hypoxic response protein 1 [Pelotomaculum schinkii]